MRSDQYYRIHLACLDMAKQSNVPDAQARWLAMASACLKLATEHAERSPDDAEVKTALAEKERALLSGSTKDALAAAPKEHTPGVLMTAIGRTTKLDEITSAEQFQHAGEAKLEAEKLLRMQLRNRGPLRKPNLIGYYREQIRKLDKAMDAYRGQDR